MTDNPFAQFAPQRQEQDNPFAQFAASTVSPEVLDQPQEKGILDSLSDRFDSFIQGQYERGKNLQNIVYETGQGNQTLGEAALQMSGHAAGTAADVVGSGVGAVAETGFRALPDAGQDALRSAGKYIADSPVGQKTGELMTAYNRNLEAYDKAYPRSGRNFEAIRELGVLTPLKTPRVIGAVGNAADKAGESFKNVAKDVIPQVEKGTVSVKEFNDMSKASYDAAEASGETFSNKLRVSIIDSLRKNLREESFIDDEDIIERALKTAESRADQPISIKGVDNLDKQITDLIRTKRRSGAEGEASVLMNIQDDIRDAVEKTEAGQLLAEARGLWSAKKKMENISDILEDADLERPGVRASYIQRSLKTLVKNKRRMDGYTDAEKKLIRKVARGTLPANILNDIVGSKPMSLLFGYSIGGPGGAVVGLGTSLLAKRAASRSSKRGISKIEREISKRAVRHPDLGVLNKSTVDAKPEIKALPAPDTSLKVNRQGEATKMTTKDLFEAQKAREKARETGLTPDVRRVQIRNEINKAYEQRDMKRNKIKEDQMAKIAESSAIPIAKMIEMSDKKIAELAEIVERDGSTGAIAKALREAVKKQRGKQ